MAGPRDYVCQYCGKSFVHQPSLIRHRRKCEGNFYLSCELCGKPFHRRDSYQRHLKHMHNMEDSKKGTLGRRGTFTDIYTASEEPHDL